MINCSRFKMRTILFIITGICGFGFAAELPTHQASERKSVDLTVYNSNFALIREERTMLLNKGNNSVLVPDVPATIDATSLHFSSITDPNGVKVLEQNYQYDLVNQNKLLEKYLGKNVEFIRMDSEKKKEYSVSGKILAVGDNVENNGGTLNGSNAGLVVEIDGKIELNPVGRLVLPSLPEGLILKPQLQWLLASEKAGEQKTEISYLASSLSWSCDYVVLLNQNDVKMDLKGWVTLTNNSGTTFKDAGLKLVAGEVNRVQGEDKSYAVARMANLKLAARSEEAPQFNQKELFEYKIYSLQRRTNLANNESKQIELVSSQNVPVKKMFVYDGLENDWRFWIQNDGFRNQGNFGQSGITKIGTYLIFRNDEKSMLGMPLPKGKVRVYKKDEEGKEQFIGENLIDHTAKNEEVKLYLGNAFDLVGARAQKDFKVIKSGHENEETFEIKVRNHKKEAVEVMVYEHPWRSSEWKIVKSTVPMEKVDQNTLRAVLKVDADQEAVLNYTIRYNW